MTDADLRALARTIARAPRRLDIAHVLDWPRCARHGARCVELRDGRLWCLDCNARPAVDGEPRPASPMPDEECPVCRAWNR